MPYFQIIDDREPEFDTGSFANSLRMLYEQGRQNKARKADSLAAEILAGGGSVKEVNEAMNRHLAPQSFMGEMFGNITGANAEISPNELPSVQSYNSIDPSEQQYNLARIDKIRAETDAIKNRDNTGGQVKLIYFTKDGQKRAKYVSKADYNTEVENITTNGGNLEQPYNNLSVNASQDIIDQFPQLMKDMPEQTRVKRWGPLPNDDIYGQTAYEKAVERLKQTAGQLNVPEKQIIDMFNNWWDQQYNAEEGERFQKYGDRGKFGNKNNDTPKRKQGESVEDYLNRIGG